MHNVISYNVFLPTRFDDSGRDDLESEFCPDFGVADVDQFQLNRFPVDFRRMWSSNWTFRVQVGAQIIWNRCKMLSL